MKNFHAFSVPALETELVAEVAAWSAMAQAELAVLERYRELLKNLLAGLPRSHATCRMAAAQCRSYRRGYKASNGIIDNLEYQLAILRDDELLPF